MKKINLHHLVWYFFIYSILGMIMENCYCFITTGVIESRKGFIIGPFCPIYGVGSIILTIALPTNRLKWKNIFWRGLLIGTCFEYISSYTMQAVYGVKFWDYNGSFANINGRTNLMYATCWGILSLILIYFLNPKVEKFIKKFEFKSLDIIILTFMIMNSLLTYNEINGYVSKTENRLVNDKIIEFVFPNMKIP